MEDYEGVEDVDFRKEIDEDENQRLKRLNENDRMYKFYKHYYVNPEKNSNFNKVHKSHVDKLKRNSIRLKVLEKLRKGERLGYLDQSILVNHFHDIFSEEESKALLAYNKYAQSKLMLFGFVSVNVYFMLRRTVIEYFNLTRKNLNFRVFKFFLVSSLVTFNYIGIKYDPFVKYNIEFLMKNSGMILISNPNIAVTLEKEILLKKHEEILKSSEN